MAEDSRQKHTYDEVPYSSYPFRQSHPDRLATIGTLFGLQPAPLDRCRVLELGCAQGGNLIPIADQFPGAQCLGVDASARAVEVGRETIATVGLENIRLLHSDILDLDQDLGGFDYIIVHGVFSWVPPAVQDRILALCGNHLEPQGIAYISYNTYPGWHMRGMIRDLMHYHASFFDMPDRQVREARGLLDFLTKAVPIEDSTYGRLLADELRGVGGKADYYLYHEYLEEFNEPLYFHQFAERAGQFGLQYLGEADYNTMSASNFPAQVKSRLQAVASDTIRMEQYMDFVRNRMFRQTLLCRADRPLDRGVPPNRLFPLHLASSAKPEDAGPVDLRPGQSVTFNRPGSTLTTRQPLVKAAMLQLGHIWPRSISFAELLTAARARLNPAPVVVEADRERREQEALAEPLLRCYATTHVDLSFQACPFTLDLPDPLCVTGLARHQAACGAEVTNLLHETVRLNDPQRFLLRNIDGRRGREDLLALMLESIHRKELVLRDQGTVIEDSGRVQELARQIVQANLEQLAGKCLLLGPPGPASKDRPATAQ